MHWGLLLAVTLCFVHSGLGYETPEELPFGTTFLSGSNRAEYTKTEKSDRGRFLKGIYEQVDESGKHNILNEVVPKCYSWWLTEEQRAEIEALHVSGNHDACKKRIRTLLNEQPDEKRQNIESYWEFCEHLWYSAHNHGAASGHNHHKNHDHSHRHLRASRHINENYEEFAKDHLGWLSEEEKAEVKKLHDENKEQARQKVMEILDASTGEKKEQGIAALRGACRELITLVLGEEKAGEIKRMKESGSTNEQIGQKITELLETVTNETLKQKALEHKAVCAKLYELKTSKKRRNVHHHDIESKLRSEWNWLTEEQKEEIRQLKTQGKSDEQLLSKVFEYFKSADDKSKAEDGLQTSCGSAILTILGSEKAEVLKSFMANGATPEAYEQKVKELLNEAPKKTLTPNQENCKLVFTGATRRRRHEGHNHEGHHHHTLEDYLESPHLSWLTDLQKESVRKLAQEGKSKEVIQKQILDYYDATEGELKEKATSGLQSGCRELFTKLIGTEKADQLKALKESGATNEELRNKGDQFVEEITDEKQKQEAKFYAVGCRKVFGVESKRKRHTHSHGEHHSLEELFKTYLSWLTEDQQKQLTDLKAEGKSREDIQKKVLEFYEAASDSVKETAREKMQDGCRKLLVKVLGEEKAAELKQLRESGTPLKELADKTTNWISELTDETAKESAKNYAVVCNKAFEIQ